MTVLPESFPFPSPHSFSLLLVETLSPHQEWCAVGVYVYTPLRERPCGAGVPLVPLTWLRHVRVSIDPHTTVMERERREKRERREGKERRGEEGGKNGG